MKNPFALGRSYMAASIVNGISNYYINQQRMKQQAELHELSMKHQLEMNERNFQRAEQRFEAEKDFQREMARLRYADQLRLAELNFKRTKLLKDYDQLLRSYPLKVPSDILIDYYQRYHSDAEHPIPMMVMLSPPQVTPPRGNNMKSVEFSELEEFVAHEIRRVLDPYIKQNRIKFLGGIWEKDALHSEAAAHLLYSIYSAVPVLFIETRVVLKNIYIYAGGWTLGQSEPAYTLLHHITNYDQRLNSFAELEASLWAETKQKQLDAGNDEASVMQAGGHREKNLQQLKRKEMGLSNLQYQITDEHRQALYEDISMIHSLMIAWLSDVYHLEMSHLLPIMPNILSNLQLHDSSEFIDSIIEQYDHTLTQLDPIYSHLIPELRLELLEGLASLPASQKSAWQLDKALRSYLDLIGADNSTDPVEGLLFVVNNAPLDNALRLYRPLLKRIHKVLISMNDDRQYQIEAILQKWHQQTIYGDIQTDELGPIL